MTPIHRSAPLDFSVPLDTVLSGQSKPRRRGPAGLRLSRTARMALQGVGQNIRTARLRRGESESLAAERAGVSRQTWAKLEQGEATVSAGLLFEALVLYGFDAALFDLGAPELDVEGMARDAARRPKRGRRSGTAVSR